MVEDKIIYDWELYDVVGDDHFNCMATIQEVIEALPDPDRSVRLIRYDREGNWEDCHIAPDGTFENDAVFFGGYGRKVPKRYIEQVARWVKRYGYECREVWKIDEE